MIPIRLAVEGLYSYQQRQEVNFNRLIESGLFGIFGQVGSGKTSLLEAISFVLYGRSERLNAKTDNRAYNMMNLRTGQMRIEFEFRAGASEQRYRYIYEAKRNRKQHHEINTGDRKVYRWESDQWMPQSVEKTDIGLFTQQVLGLDYDNFKRTVIIPQNQFREFLELSPTDRTQMMMHLFDLNRFDLADPTSKLDKANQTELDNLTGQLAGLEAATPEAVEAAQAALTETLATIDQQNGQLMVLESEEKRLLHLRDRHTKLAEARADLSQLTAEKPAFDRLTQQVEQYEQTERVFRPLFQQLTDLANKHQQITAKIQPLTRRLDTLQHELPGLIQQQETKLQQFTNRHNLREQIDEYGIVRQIRVNQTAVADGTNRLQKLTAQAMQQATKIDQKVAERTQQQTLLDTFGQPAAQLDVLNQIQRWFDLNGSLQKTIEKITGKIRVNDDVVETIKQKKDKALHGFPPAWIDQKLKELPTLIEQEIEALKTVQEQQKTVHDNNLLKDRLQQYANALTDGNPCPLCGAEHHPAVHQDNNIGQAVKKSGLAVKETTVRLDKLTALLTQMHELRADLKNVVEQSKALAQEKDTALSELNDHANRFVWPNFSPTEPAALTEAIRQQTANQLRLNSTQKQIDQSTKGLEKARTEHTKTVSEASALSATLVEKKQLIDSQLAQFNHIRAEEVVAFDLTQIDDLVRELTKQFAQTQTDYDQANRALTEAQNQRIRHQADLHQLTQQQTDSQQEQAAKTIELTDALAQHGLTRQTVETILKTKLDPIASRQQLRDFTVRLTVAQTKTDDLTAELAYQPFDPADLVQVQADCVAAKTAYHAAHQQLGERTEAYTKLRDQWTQKQTLLQRFDDLSLRRDDLKELKGLFREKGFAKYVSSVRLRELCQAANDRFCQLTNNHLRLEFEDDNFIVRDFLNGGKTRLAKTLSGGQMFQAALSLALALSENIQHLTQSKQNLFFLDEGFGTLDKTALQTVFETLKSLRRENRIVGIISHVEELQQEFETYIRTISTDTGSRIECSWEVGELNS